MIHHVYHAMYRDGRRWGYLGTSWCHPEAPYIEGSVAALPAALRVDYQNDVAGMRWEASIIHKAADPDRIEMMHHAEALRVAPDLETLLLAMAEEAMAERRREHEEAREAAREPPVIAPRSRRGAAEESGPAPKPWRPVRRRRGV